MVLQGLPVPDPDVNQCTKFIKSALRTCNSDHVRCNSHNLVHGPTGGNVPKFVPRRLLYIGSNQPVDRIRLCESENEAPSSDGPGLQYAALSHCWGGVQIVRTTEASLSESLTSGISWSALCTTFKDAISFAREIGLEYIWIDSLCKTHHL